LRLAVRGAAVLMLAPAPAQAHVGRCTGPETASTVVVAAILSVVLFRPWRKSVSNAASRVTRVVLPIMLIAGVTLTGCGGKKAPTSAGGPQPTTTARIQIDSPTTNQVVGADITVKVTIIGGRVVQRATGPLTATEGHVHVSVDDQLVAMAYGTTQDLHGLKPGQHSVSAEFVAVNHQSFANPTRAFVLFTVQ
jgi:hypothetical protein